MFDVPLYPLIINGERRDVVSLSAKKTFVSYWVFGLTTDLWSFPVGGRECLR